MPTASPADLVLEGGGVKGIALAGAYAALADGGVRPHRVAGTSAGAIAAALIAAGFTADELTAALAELPLRELLDRGGIDRVPVVGPVLSVLLERGIHEGRVLEAWVRDRLAEKGVARFGDLPGRRTAPGGPSPLLIVASDLTERRVLVLPDDAGRLGIDPDDLDVAWAVRASCAIPIVFEPVVHRNPRTGVEHVIVDGGVLSNFPVWLFDAEGRPPRWPTIGLKLVESEPRRPLGDPGAPADPGIVGYVRSLAETVMQAHDRLYLESADFVRTVPIPTLGVGTTEFDVSPERIAALQRSGYAAAEAFLRDWDFDGYVRAFRTAGRPALPSRSQRLREVLRAARPPGDDPRTRAGPPRSCRR